MNFEHNGQYLPTKPERELADGVEDICPFSNSSKNEDAISCELYSGNGAEHDQYIGSFLACYAGYVKESTFREKGSSGGLVTWIAAKLLEENLADAIIHVTHANDGDGILFKYAISSKVDELQSGAKSKYYPVEVSQVMNHVLHNEGRYAFVGVPCFVKAVRLLAEKEPIIRKRIKYTIGLVCGHLKTDRFAKAMAWEMGIPPKALTGFDFRVKTTNQPASRYQVQATGQSDYQLVEKKAFAKDLFASNWGYGFFKLKACDYCDDVVAETADVSVGDAWLPEYVNDSAGNSVVVVRNQTIIELLNEHRHELKIDMITPAEVFQSQAGGFRHRREGLAYRLFLMEQENQWYPKKRVQASNIESAKRQEIYKHRIRLREESHNAFHKAEEANDFGTFIRLMMPSIRKYDKLNRPKGLGLLIFTAKHAMKRLFG